MSISPAVQWGPDLFEDFFKLLTLFVLTVPLGMWRYLLTIPLLVLKDPQLRSLTGVAITIGSYIHDPFYVRLPLLLLLAASYTSFASQIACCTLYLLHFGYIGECAALTVIAWLKEAPHSFEARSYYTWAGVFIFAFSQQ